MGFASVDGVISTVGKDNNLRNGTRLRRDVDRISTVVGL